MRIRPLLTVLFATMCIAATPPYLDPGRPIEERVEDALSRMTRQEKAAMCHAQSKFSAAGVPRLGIPENWMTDGPHGIRPEVLWDEWDQAGWTNDSCTAFPALTCLAATWNRDMALLYGTSIGAEARYRNKNVLLGPGVNIYRTPLNGRNFEYMGEDPYLTSKMVVPYIKGVQANGVAACVKHFALNNQEDNRLRVNVSVDDRALYEIYLPAFKAAVTEGGAWAVMGAYNRYNNQWLCENERLLDTVLRGEWGFDGVVVSDWGGVHNTMPAILHGIDMEFDTWLDGRQWNASNAYENYHLAQPFLQMIKQGEVSEAALDAKVRRILRLAFRTTMAPRRPFGSFATPEHFAAARKIAEEGIVLLKNDGNVLPLAQPKRLLVVGENAVKAMTVGGGSSSLKAHHEISPLDGLQKRFPNAEVVWARGYVGDVTGTYNGVTSGQNLAESRSPEELLREAVELARTADAVIFVGGLNKSGGQDCEGADRASLELPYGQNELIAALAQVTPRLVVVNVSGNAVAMPWLASVPAVVQTWYNGSESGTALAAILAGDVNPSGRLPFTFPQRLEDCGAHAAGEYPGSGDEVSYKEGMFVGYRWADLHKITPLFPFGHGLSYTTFEWGKPSVTALRGGSFAVSVAVRNTGSRAGAEVVQLYVRDVKSSLLRPIKELKGFEKIFLEPGQQQVVTLTIDRAALSYFDDQRHEWVAEPGNFEALVGASATDIRGRAEFELADDLRAMIGGMIVAGFRGAELEHNNHIIKDITDRHIAGVVLFDYDTPSRKYDRNIKSPAQLQRLVKQLRALNPTLLVGIDQEGGRVSRLKERYGFPASVSAQKLGVLDSEEETRATAALTAKTLAAMGVDINFAPCVDLNVNPSCPVIGAVERSFGADPTVVVRHASATLDEFEKAGIKGCLKHFPGHGSSTKDTHLAAADVTQTWSERELEPYINLMQRAQLIMTSHIFNAHLDAKMPATMSHAILTGLLRNKLGYQGVIITDDLGMGAMVDNYSLEQILVQAVNAGADLLCLGNNGTSYDPRLVEKAVNIIERAVEDGRISRSRIDEANKRVAQLR